MVVLVVKQRALFEQYTRTHACTHELAVWIGAGRVDDTQAIHAFFMFVDSSGGQCWFTNLYMMRASAFVFLCCHDYGYSQLLPVCLSYFPRFLYSLYCLHMLLVCIVSNA